MLKTMLKSTIAFLFLLSVAVSANERFGGIGLSVAQLFDPLSETKNGELVVLDVVPGTDAQVKGIQRGDVITKIDQVNTAGADFGTLVTNNLRGAVGSESVLEIRRAGTSDIITVTVTRVEIKYPG